MSDKNPLSRQVVLSLCIYIALGGAGLLFRHLRHSEAHAAPAIRTERVAVAGIGRKVVQPRERNPGLHRLPSTDLHAVGQTGGANGLLQGGRSADAPPHTGHGRSALVVTHGAIFSGKRPGGG